MGFASRMEGVASKLLGKFDESDGRIVLVRRGEAVWDDTLAEMVPGIEEQISMVGVTIPVGGQVNTPFGLVDGTTVQTGDILVKVTSAVEPTLNDKLEFDGAQWSIVAIIPVRYTNQTIMYTIQARK